jgi:hypothetical protein
LWIPEMRTSNQFHHAAVGKNLAARGIAIISCGSRDGFPIRLHISVPPQYVPVPPAAFSDRGLNSASMGKKKCRERNFAASDAKTDYMIT